jgi:hypothetical protein
MFAVSIVLGDGGLGEGSAYNLGKMGENVNSGILKHDQKRLITGMTPSGFKKMVGNMRVALDKVSHRSTEGHAKL